MAQLNPPVRMHLIADFARTAACGCAVYSPVTAIPSMYQELHISADCVVVSDHRVCMHDSQAEG